MKKGKTCSIKQFTLTKNETNFLNEHENLIHKLQESPTFRQKGGDNAAGSESNSNKGLMQQTASMIVESIGKIGVNGAAKMITLMLPTKIQEKIIKAGEHERKLQMYLEARQARQSERMSQRMSDSKKTEKKRGGSEGSLKKSDKPTAAVYVGERNAQNQKHGKGKMTWVSGAEYDGDWKNDTRTGKGKLTQTNGEVYEGDFVNGVKEGKGKIVYANGDEYEGEWKNDQQHGNGTYTFQNKSTYTGKWVNNVMTGFGKFKYFNGDLYEGLFVKGVREGEGKMLYENGEKYIGFWHKNMRHGKGKQEYKNGDIFEGKWKRDKREGAGKLIHKDGAVVEDTWENDETTMEGFKNMFSSVNASLSPTIKMFNESKNSLYDLTNTCTALQGVITALVSITAVFSSLTGSGTPAAAAAASASASANANASASQPSGSDTSYMNYTLYLGAAIGTVTLAKYFYTRIFGSEADNEKLDKSVLSKRSSSNSASSSKSSSTRKNRRS